MERDRLRRAAHDAAKAWHLGNDSDVPAGVDGSKMSEVLLDFIGPLLDRAESDADVERLVALGATAWNAALLDAEQRTALVRSAIAASGTQGREEMERALDTLVARKLRHFAGDRRVIADYEVSTTSDGPHVMVMWSPPAAR